VNGSIKLPPIRTWPLKHSKELLLEAATDQSTFNRGYRQLAVSPGELAFPSFDQCIQSGLTAGELLARKMPSYCGVDLAGKKRPGNAIASVGAAAAGMRALLDIRFGGWKSPETAKQIGEVDMLVNPQFIQVENNGYQQSLVDWAKESQYSYWPKVEPFTTGLNKTDPEVGLAVLEVEFHNKAWIIPGAEFEGHPPDCACSWCRLVTEFRSYPFGSSTDGVMAFWFARDALAKWAPIRGGTPLRRNFTRR
jgi:hypothetical protein